MQMTPQRYNQLMKDVSVTLTPEEVAAGYFFCACEWDGLLIHKDDLEAQYCSCFNGTRYGP